MSRENGTEGDPVHVIQNLPDKDLFRPDEVAAYFAVSRQTIYKWIREGRLQAVGPRKARRIPRVAIAALLVQSISDD